MTIDIRPEFPVFYDNEGELLDGGYIYIGEYGKNPETNPVAVEYETGVSASQPLRTVRGRVDRNGSPAVVRTSDNYSITIRDRNENLVYSNLEAPNTSEQTAFETVRFGTDAATNSDRLRAGLANAASRGVPLDTRGLGTIDLDGTRITFPEEQQFSWISDHLTTFNIQGANSSGVFGASSADLEVQDAWIEGVRINVEDDPSYGIPYDTQIFVGIYRRCQMIDLRIDRWAGRRAFSVILYECNVVRPRFTCEDWDVDSTGYTKAGGFRILGGRDTVVSDVYGVSQDDCLQCVPLGGTDGWAAGAEMVNISYIGGFAQALEGRAIICQQTYNDGSASSEDGTFGEFNNIKFSNITARGTGRCVAIYSQYNVSKIQNVVLDNITVDCLIKNVVTPYYPECVFIGGHVFGVRGDLTFVNPTSMLVRTDTDYVDEFSTKAPKFVHLEVLCIDPPADDVTEPAIYINDGSEHITIRPYIANWDHATTDTNSIIYVRNSANVTIEKGFVGGTQSGITHVIEVNSLDTVTACENLSVTDMVFEGDAQDAIRMNTSESRATAKVTGNRLGGMDVPSSGSFGVYENNFA